MVPRRGHAGTPMVVNKYDSYSVFDHFQADMTTGRSLFRSLLSYTASERQSNNAEPASLDHHSQISLACSLLTDASRQGPEVSCFGFFLPFSRQHRPRQTN